jgi:hypothetical protein
MVPIVRLVAVTAAAARLEASSQRLSTLGTVSIVVLKKSLGSPGNLASQSSRSEGLGCNSANLGDDCVAGLK